MFWINVDTSLRSLKKCGDARTAFFLPPPTISLSATIIPFSSRLDTIVFGLTESIVKDTIDDLSLFIFRSKDRDARNSS